MLLGTDDVYNVAATLLHFVEVAACERSVQLPQRRVINAGGAVYDCELVSVSVAQLTLGLPSEGSSRLVPSGPSAWTVFGDVAIVRRAAEMPQGPQGTGMPRVQDILRDVAVLSQDSAIIADAVNMYAELARDSTLSINIAAPLGGLIATQGSYSLPVWTTGVPPVLPRQYAFPLER